MTYLTVDCKNKSLMDIKTWCDSHYGETNWHWQWGFSKHHWTFYLPTDYDATVFLLKWR